MENYFHRLQEQVYQKNRIETTWVNSLKQLYKLQHTGIEPITPEICINKKEGKKGKKCAGPDGLINELLKYGEESLTKQLKVSINEIIFHHRIPNE